MHLTASKPQAERWGRTFMPMEELGPDNGTWRGADRTFPIPAPGPLPPLLRHCALCLNCHLLQAYIAAICACRYTCHVGRHGPCPACNSNSTYMQGRRPSDVFSAFPKPLLFQHGSVHACLLVGKKQAGILLLWPYTHLVGGSRGTSSPRCAIYRASPLATSPLPAHRAFAAPFLPANERVPSPALSYIPRSGPMPFHALRSRRRIIRAL